MPRHGSMTLPKQLWRITGMTKESSKNLQQIQAIDANYFTVSQILNQFIYGLCSSILQYVYTLHLNTLQDAVIHTRNFKSAKLEANHTQAINLVINRPSELDSKLKQFSDFINQKLEGNILTKLHTYNAATNLSATNLSANSTCHLLPTAPTYLSAAVSSNLPAATNSNTVAELISKQNSKTETDTAKLEIVNEEMINTLLFSGAALKEKPITAMYTDVKVDNHAIKLILDSELAGSIITCQLMD
ncbi:hypothetical protein G9A89_013691 [Geosiphon pyriformis]|nr:hypothetical protein G9A89_013691 [Geosiphon pyriformis]